MGGLGSNFPGPLTVDGQRPYIEYAVQVALTGTATVTSAQLAKRILDGTPVAAATYTLPTAALLVAYLKTVADGEIGRAHV